MNVYIKKIRTKVPVVLSLYNGFMPAIGDLYEIDGIRFVVHKTYNENRKHNASEISTGLKFTPCCMSNREVLANVYRIYRRTPRRKWDEAIARFKSYSKNRFPLNKHLFDKVLI